MAKCCAFVALLLGVGVSAQRLVLRPAKVAAVHSVRGVTDTNQPSSANCSELWFTQRVRLVFMYVYVSTCIYVLGVCGC
jgi:hypothetical protein